MLEAEGPALLRAAIKRAKAGNGAALRALLGPLLPRERRVRFDLAVPAQAADAPGAIGAVLEAVSQGELTPAEAQAVVAIVSAQVRSFEASELAQRLDELQVQLEELRATERLEGRFR